MESQKISQLQRLKQVKTSYLLPEGFSQCVQSVSQSVRQTDRQRGKQGCGRYKPLFQQVRVCIYRSVFLSESQMINQHSIGSSVDQSVGQSVIVWAVKQLVSHPYDKVRRLGWSDHPLCIKTVGWFVWRSAIQKGMKRGKWQLFQAKENDRDSLFI